MGVYIKGMEMPECCEECILDHKFFKWLGCNKHVTGSMIENGERSPSCPLIEVQPHGRLIDEKAVIDHFVSLSNNQWNQNASTSWADAFAEAASDICDIPTVIEAEVET